MPGAPGAPLQQEPVRRRAESPDRDPRPETRCPPHLGPEGAGAPELPAGPWSSPSPPGHPLPCLRLLGEQGASPPGQQCVGGGRQTPRDLACLLWGFGDLMQLLLKGLPHKAHLHEVTPVCCPVSTPPLPDPTHSKNSFTSHLVAVRSTEIGWEGEGTHG